jgi:hypothetical protein
VDALHVEKYALGFFFLRVINLISATIQASWHQATRSMFLPLAPSPPIEIRLGKLGKSQWDCVIVYAWRHQVTRPSGCCMVLRWTCRMGRLTWAFLGDVIEGSTR